MLVKGFVLFDIDGVIRDVTNSYRLAIQKTVGSFCGWEPSIEDIDGLKSEGFWNNDWDVSLELIKRYKKDLGGQFNSPTREILRNRFDSFYFGEKLQESGEIWTGFINNETLLVRKKFFETLSSLEIKWGFVSGAEYPSAKFVLESRLGIKAPPLVAMGDAPDKPNPTGFLTLVSRLAECSIDTIQEPIAYLGDTVADVLTIQEARKEYPYQRFISFAISPPHLQLEKRKSLRKTYEYQLKKSGADIVLKNTEEIIEYIKRW